MLAVTGILLLAAAAGLFQLSLRRGKYRRYPHELFVVVGAAVLVGIAAVLVRPSVWAAMGLMVEVAAFGGLTWYMIAGARYRRGKVSVVSGDRMPRFVLQDSLGHSFDSESLSGSTALYLFYRGPW